MLFGEHAIRLKLATIDQVEESLREQEKLKKEGKSRPLGAIMLDKGYLSRFQVDEIARAMHEIEEGSELIKGYRIEKKLGEGAMGTVYRGKQMTLNRDVAIKILSPVMAQDEEFLSRFLREARSAARLNHANIVQAVDAGESHGYYYFIMEFVEGDSLEELLNEKKRFTEPEVIEMVLQVASALAHAAEHNIVHRDIKPANILIDKNGRAKLCDMGLAKEAREQGGLTRPGMILGSPFYLSPEQALEEKLDSRSDIYSLGVTMYHLLTGHVPYRAENPADILNKVVYASIPNASESNPELSPGICRVIQKMMAKEPEDRYQTPDELIEDIHKLKRGEELSITPQKGFFSRLKNLFGRG
jgi:serine/threonine-protein kinase